MTRSPATWLRDVGGKNAQPRRAKERLKLTVPDAFAITTRAFDAFMRHNRILAKTGLPADNGPVSEAMLQEMHELVLHGTMPPELSRAIEKAVHSSGRAAPDASCRPQQRRGGGRRAFPLPGQFDTVLNVPLDARGSREGVPEGACQPLLRQSRRSIRPGWVLLLRDMKMAVACMVMVDAEASGVLYSAIPAGTGTA